MSSDGLSSSSHDELNVAPKDPEDESENPKSRGVGIRERVDQFTWSWFTCTQSTGGIAVLLSETPNQFDGLQTIGIVVFIFNLVLFLAFLAIMITRWVLNPKRIKESFINPPENFFFGSLWLSFATVIICMQRYAVPHTGPWMIVAIRVCFWIYAAITFTSSTIHLAVIFKYTPIKAIEMNPAWFLLIFNAMLTGTVAAAIAADQPPHQRIPIIVAGVSYQGLGWIVSLLFLSFFIGHLMEKGWPAANMRPGLFMPVGSSGYTIVALIGAARATPKGYAYFETHPTAPEVLLIVATWVGIFMWMFTLWLFGLALVVNLCSVFKKTDGRWRLNMGFTMSWWAFIFPNVGFNLATVFIGQELQSPAILWVSTTMTILLVIFWLFDLVLMAKYVVSVQRGLKKSPHDDE